MLRKVNEANLLAIRQQKYTEWAFVSIIILLTALILITFRTGRQRKKMNMELFDNNAELERLNSVKDKLFSVISHDLRSPIANLKSVLHLLREGYLEKEEFEKISTKLSHQLETSGNALENLLQWAKAQLSDVKAKPEQIFLADVAHEVGRQFKEELEEKQILFQNLVDRNLSAWADKNQVEIILRNLVGNAIKFTQEGGFVKVDGKLSNSFIRISVEDNGIGMSETAQQNLFQPGKHFTTSGTRQEKGTGIGLLIAREMVINNRGKLLVDSLKDRGTTITFLLPVFSPNEHRITSS
jgi:signal transduction histidine kinase